MFRLALRNTLRQKTRSALSLLIVAFGVAALILSGGFVEDIFEQLAEALIHSQSGHLQVFRSGYFEHGTRSPDKFIIERPDRVQSTLASQPQVADTMTRLSFSGMINNGRTDLPIIGEGIEADQEGRLGSYLTVQTGRQLKDSDRYGIVLGAGVAHALKLTPGTRVTLLVNTPQGALNNLDFEVIGVFQTFSRDYDAHAVRIPLAAAQELLNTTGVTSVIVSLHRTPDTELVVQAARRLFDPNEFEVKSWIQLNSFYEKTVDLYRQQFGALQLIILITVLLGVANTVSMSVLERVGEFGTIMSLGNRSSYVFRLIITENVLLGLAGTSLGVLLGGALAWLISAIGIPMPPPPNADLGYTARILIVPSALLMAYVIGLSATILAAILPAWRASTTPVAEALRQNY